MQETTDLEAFQALLADVLAFYRQDVSAFALSVWWRACRGASLEQVRRALTAHTLDPDRGQFAPKPADIVRVLHGTTTDRALVAWGKTYEAMKGVGSYRSVAFDDPAIHCAIEDMGGWPALCRTFVDDLPFVQRRFCDAYRTHDARKTPHVPRLVGASEADNAGKTLNADQRAWMDSQTVLIGDAGKARAVMLTGGGSPRAAVTLLASDAVLPPRPRLASAA